MKNRINSNQGVKGRYLKVKLYNIPRVLKKLRKWVCWKGVRKGDSWTKVPFNAISLNTAKINDPDDWTDGKKAHNSMKENDFDGIGYVLTDDDPYVGIDIDHCVDRKTKEITSYATKIIKLMNSYTEFSPSGEGIRIFIKGELPSGGRRRKTIELYDNKRYLTLTGNHLKSTPKKIRSRKAEINRLHGMLFKKPLKLKKPKKFSVLEDERLEVAFKSKNGSKIKRLYEGNTIGYGSHSEADLALCAYIAFWFEHDPVQIDKVFRSSGLFREKWDKLHGSMTYGQMTIQEAINSSTDIYQPSSIPEIFTAAELSKKKLPKMRWLVRGILPEGLIVLAGKPKVGKSWFALQLCIAVTLKENFISANTIKKRVMYLSLEDSYARLKSRINSLLDGNRPPKNLYLTNSWSKVKNGGIRKLKNEITTKKIRLVVIDTFQRIRPKSSGRRNMYHVDYEHVSAIKMLADKHRITILLIHHLRKADAEDDVDTISGSTGLTGSADGTLILKKDRGSLNATLSITGRDIQERKLLIVFNENNTSWSYIGEADAHYRNQERQDIIDVVEAVDGPLGPKEIAESLDLPDSKHQNIRQLVLKMVKSGELVKVGYGKYNIRNREL